ncbi:MAG: bifunctional glycosyltransferase family 2/GtrA family protein [Lachnospiraceae bacterium]|nr:bifunctional glycosyltransferase family 2/GtrA family protein [Lachnospiraceae bacterium]
MVVIIPSYNPDHHLKTVLQELHEQTDYQIIVVDDGSNEQCKKNFVGLEPQDILLKHKVNRGKGAAIKTGLSYVMEHKTDEGVIFIDGDGQHRIQDVINVVQCWESNKEAVVLGARTFDKDIPWKSKLGNEATKLFFRLLTGKKLKDTQTGLRAFGTKYFEELSAVAGDRYEYEMNALMSLVKSKAQIIEVPIVTVYENNKNETTHFRPIRDSIRIYSVLFKFLFSSCACAIIDYAMFFALLYLCGNPQEGLSVVLCNVAARVVSGISNYCINRNYVFGSKAKKVKSGLQYAALCVAILCFNSVCLYIFTEYLHFPPGITKVIVETFSFIVSFVIQHRKIF